MADAKALATSLSEDERAAVRGFPFSDAIGERLLAASIFASRDGWPLSDLGGAVDRELTETARG